MDKREERVVRSERRAQSARESRAMSPISLYGLRGQVDAKFSGAIVAPPIPISAHRSRFLPPSFPRKRGSRGLGTAFARHTPRFRTSTAASAICQRALARAGIGNAVGTPAAPSHGAAFGGLLPSRMSDSSRRKPSGIRFSFSKFRSAASPLSFRARRVTFVNPAVSSDSRSVASS